MIRTAVATLLLMSVATTADAAACRDAKGKFIKCPPAAAASPTGITKGKDGRCRLKGKFVKCPA